MDDGASHWQGNGGAALVFGTGSWRCRFSPPPGALTWHLTILLAQCCNHQAPGAPSSAFWSRAPAPCPAQKFLPQSSKGPG